MISKQILQFREPATYPQRYKTNPDADSKHILQREAKAINAEVSWYKTKTYIEITVSAPNHFLWACNKEHELTHQCPYNQSAEAVRELLQLMQEGFIRTKKHKCDDSCECDSCEALEDEELQELRF